ncbi:DUF1292 domain-containing protein [Caldanaerobius polysaccharolyticus]|uniref:DUF1292 domain-containing protein n=1 Tax=Caldanaerobius polysaccharolyticus TaxID=44256 RepID=UPI00047D2BDD|nr:DUF1292 domain-containing protein [Caldanaerobius polysaccharolyticus]
MDDMNEMETIVLFDEEGNEVEFELIASLDVDDNTYVIVTPVNEDTDDAYILRVEQDENGEDVFVGIEDDDEFNAVAEAYEELSRQSDDYGDDEEEEEEED